MKYKLSKWAKIKILMSDPDFALSIISLIVSVAILVFIILYI